MKVQEAANITHDKMSEACLRPSIALRRSGGDNIAE